MFHRKLSALGYPEAAQFDGTDTQQQRSAVLWLEEQKIRHYTVEDRQPLRQLTADDWSAAFQKYLHDLAAPYPAENMDSALDWLLGRAVRLIYNEDPKKYDQKASINGTAETDKPAKPVSQNPLDNLDFNSGEFVSGVERLAELLKIPSHPDHLITLEAVATIVCERLNKTALADPSTVIVKGTPFPLASSDLGFDTGDPVLNEAAKVLRLLYIRDLRQLQTSINEILVAIQNLIADPRTDTRLGKVGR